MLDIISHTPILVKGNFCIALLRNLGYNVEAMRRFGCFTHLLAVVLTITLIVAVPIWLAQRYILPQRLTGIVNDYLKENIERKIEIGKVEYHFPNSFSLKEFSVFSKKGRRFLAIDKLGFNVSVLPFLKHKQAIIPKIHVGQLKIFPSGEKPIEVTSTDLNGELTLQLKKQGTPALSGIAKFKASKLKVPALEDPIDLNWLEIGFDEKGLNIENASGTYKDYKYIASASIAKARAPEVNIFIEKGDLTLTGSGKIFPNHIELKEANLKFLNFKLGAVGKITEYTKEARIKLDGKADLNLSDAAGMIERLSKPEQKEAALKVLQTIEPKGTCKLSFSTEGPLKNPRACKTNVEAWSESINLFKLNLGQLKAKLKAEDGILNITDFQLSPYGGSFNASLEAYLNEKRLPYKAKLTASDIDLSKWKLDTSAKDKEISGKFASEFKLNGEGFKSNSLQGSGWAVISEGHLWEIPLMGELAEFLAAPSLRKIVIKQAGGNFTVADQTLSSENLILLSDEMALIAKGHMDFKGNLDATIDSRFAPGFLSSAGQFGKVAGFLVDQTGKFVGEIKMTGTIKKPKFTLSPVRLDKFFQQNIFKPLLRQLFDR